jgi:hypothetical protein
MCLRRDTPESERLPARHSACRRLAARAVERSAFVLTTAVNRSLLRPPLALSRGFLFVRCAASNGLTIGIGRSAGPTRTIRPHGSSTVNRDEPLFRSLRPHAVGQREQALQAGGYRPAPEAALPSASAGLKTASAALPWSGRDNGHFHGRGGVKVPGFVIVIVIGPERVDYDYDYEPPPGCSAALWREVTRDVSDRANPGV